MFKRCLNTCNTQFNFVDIIAGHVQNTLPAQVSYFGKSHVVVYCHIGANKIMYFFSQMCKLNSPSRHMTAKQRRIYVVIRYVPAAQ